MHFKVGECNSRGLLFHFLIPKPYTGCHSHRFAYLSVGVIISLDPVYFCLDMRERPFALGGTCSVSNIATCIGMPTAHPTTWGSFHVASTVRFFMSPTAVSYGMSIYPLCVGLGCLGRLLNLGLHHVV